MQKQLYQLCYTPMMKLCYRYTNDAQASASLFNDAMVKIFRSIENYEEDGKLFGWIKKIVVNTCIDYVRKKTPIETSELKENYYQDVTIENEVLQKMSNADIQEIINKLPKTAALVFNLYVYEQYSHNEIAELLNMPSGTSRYLLSEARSRLKKMVLNNNYSLSKI